MIDGSLFGEEDFNDKAICLAVFDVGEKIIFCWPSPTSETKQFKYSMKSSVYCECPEGYTLSVFVILSSYGELRSEQY